MDNELTRYSLITEKLPREFLLLRGKGCVWRKCTFCDYYDDAGQDGFAVNKPIIDRITGEYSIVDVINSGSAFELDMDTLKYLRERLYEKKVNTLWLECHWLYHSRLHELSDFFEGIEVKFRIGAETFDVPTRNAWCKGIPDDIGAAEIARYFKGACLLVCVKGQTREMIRRDIELARRCFEYFSVNAFVNNSGPLRRDEELVEWFRCDILPEIKDDDGIEILLDNKDLGVG